MCKPFVFHVFSQSHSSPRRISRCRRERKYTPYLKQNSDESAIDTVTPQHLFWCGRTLTAAPPTVRVPLELAPANISSPW